VYVWFIDKAMPSMNFPHFINEPDIHGNSVLTPARFYNTTRATSPCGYFELRACVWSGFYISPMGALGDAVGDAAGMRFFIIVFIRRCMAGSFIMLSIIDEHVSAGSLCIVDMPIPMPMP
jgi:hypothetical protein